MSNKTKPGGYQLSFDGDVCYITFWGHVNEHHAAEMQQKQLDYAKGRPYLLSICDLRTFDTVSPEARKVFSTNSSELEGRGTALYGASFQARVVATLVMKAASLFAKKDSPIYFCATEQEARQWINQRRKELLIEQPARP